MPKALDSLPLFPYQSQAVPIATSERLFNVNLTNDRT